MPLEVIESTDALTDIIRLQPSPVYEMIISLRTLMRPNRFTEWDAAAHRTLPGAFWDELDDVYGRYKEGFVFFEFAVDYPDHDDVPGFLDYVRGLDPVQFVFYVIGRILPPEAIAATGLDPDALMAAVDETPFGGENCMCTKIPLDELLADVPALQGRLVDLWRWYWEGFFRHHLDDLRPRWEGGLNEKAALLNREGGQVLYEHVTGRSKLPPPLPPDQPVREIVFIPLYLLPSPVYMFYGYGNITVLYDSERTEARMAEIERDKQQAVAVLKALGDNSRLDILRLITRHGPKMHGKAIAAKLELSASAVSRHLGQLRDAGLIAEETQDNRTITYRLQEEAITGLPNQILNYLQH
jgi:DNA-binding transcriptional ArsR family regulator